ncbi:MAG: hypothetical protein PUA69_04580, partial [Erysipelotrichaceae bacterium]|nr:hypothetical protein [Erysipelotrichaceae bacterium]
MIEGFILFFFHTTPLYTNNNKTKKRGGVETPPNTWQRARFTQRAIFAADVLDFCVRDGNRYNH